MDFNVVVVAGRLAVDPEITTFESGSSVMRLLVTVRSDYPRARIDVIPVTLWDPSPELIAEKPVRGTGIWAAGAVQRRFWSSSSARQSRIEIVAHELKIMHETESAMSDVAS